jgi:valyl-tRNA synthetase
MGYLPAGQFLMQRELPKTPLVPTCAAESQSHAAAIYETAGRLRNLKVETNVASRKDVKFIIKGFPDWLSNETKVLALLAGAGEIALDPSYEAPKGTPATLTPIGEAYLPLDGLIDVDAERTRLTREIERIKLEVKKCEGKLGNASFVDRAPPEVVVQEKERLADWNAKLIQLGEMLSALA